MCSCRNLGCIGGPGDGWIGLAVKNMIDMFVKRLFLLVVDIDGLRIPFLEKPIKWVRYFREFLN